MGYCGILRGCFSSAVDDDDDDDDDDEDGDDYDDALLHRKDL